MKYDYLEAVTNDAKNAILKSYHDWHFTDRDELEEACNEFGQDIGEAVKQGAEYCDVTIRCYLLSQAISAAIDELEEKGKIQYQEEEN